MYLPYGIYGHCNCRSQWGVIGSWCEVSGPWCEAIIITGTGDDKKLACAADEGALSAIDSP